MQHKKYIKKFLNQLLHYLSKNHVAKLAESDRFIFHGKGGQVSIRIFVHENFLLIFFFLQF